MRIGELTAELAINTGQFNAGLKAAQANIKRTGAQFEAAAARMRAAAARLDVSRVGASFTRLKTSVAGSMAAAQAAVSRTVARFPRLQAAISSSMAAAQAAVSRAAAPFHRLRAVAASSMAAVQAAVSRAATRIGVFRTAVSATVARAGAALSGFAANVARWGAKVGRQMQEVGRIMATRLTLPLAAVGVAATVLGTRFGAEMTKIETLVGVSARQVSAWREAILEMAPAVGRGPGELAKALFVVTSAGERTGNALKIVEQAARASAVGLGDTATIARAVTAVMQAYSKQGLTAERATNILLRTVREGNLVAEELAGTLGRVIGIASTVGVSFEDVGAFIATFTRLGVKAEEATTSLRGTLSILARRTSPQTAAALDKAGLSMAELREMATGPGGLVKALLTIVSALGDDQEALAAVFPNIRALSGVLGVASAQSEQFAQIAKSIGVDVDTLGAVFERVTGEPLFQFQRAMSQLRVSAIRLGATFIPVAVKIADSVAGLARGFSELPDGMQKTVIALGAVLAAAGPLLIIFGQLAIITGTAGAALAGIAGPIVLAVAALASIGVAVSLTIKHWDGLVNSTRQAWAFIRSEVARGVAVILGSLASLLRSVGDVAGVLDTVPGLRGIGILGQLGHAAADSLDSAAQSAQAAASSTAALVGVYQETFRAVAGLRDMGERFGIPQEAVDATIANIRRMEEQVERGELDPSKFQRLLATVEAGFQAAGQRLVAEAQRTAQQVNDALAGGGGGGVAAIDPKILETFANMQTQMQQLGVRMQALGGEVNVPEEQLRILGETIDRFIEQSAQMDSQVSASGVTLGQLAAAYLGVKAGVDASSGALRQNQELQQAAARWLEAIKTPAERYREELAKIDLALATVEHTSEQLAAVQALAFEKAVIAMQGAKIGAEEMAVALGVSVERVQEVLDAMGRDTGQTLTQIGTDMRMLAAGMGQQIVMGIINGVQSFSDLLKNVLKTLISAAVSFGIRAALGIGSPSKLAADLGQWIPKGLALGIQQEIGAVTGASRALGTAALGSIAPAGVSLNPSFNISPDFTPEAQAVNAKWQRIFTTTARAVSAGGFRFED